MDNVNYYNDNAHEFIKNTKNANMHSLYEVFLRNLKGAKVLDLGCGSGRDSLYFSTNGYEVTAIDASFKMVEYCKNYLSCSVTHATFEDFESTELFDGIWACASLLHVKRDQIDNMIQKYVNMLNLDGIFLMSFKNRDKDFTKGGRSFTCFTETALRNQLSSIPNIDIMELFETIDVREHRDDEKWVTAIIKRIK